jgi:spore germination protein GerM
VEVFDMKLIRNTVVLVLLAGLLLTSAGCKTTEKQETKSKTPSTPVVQMTDVVVYYPKMSESETYLVREVHKVKKSSDMPRTAVEELIKGKPGTAGATRYFQSLQRFLE